MIGLSTRKSSCGDFIFYIFSECCDLIRHMSLLLSSFIFFFPLIFGPEWEGCTGTYWTQGRNVGIKRRETRTL